MDSSTSLLAANTHN